MKTSFDPVNGKWDLKCPECVSRHDVVFLTPVDDPTYGIPIGDGDTGCLIWPDKDKLKIVINKSDLFDFQGGETVSNWSAEEEDHATSLRQAAQIEIQFGAPVFDLIYQKDYEARISLADAVGTIHSKTPFSDVRIRAYAANREHTVIIECDAIFEEANSIRTIVERWGSRTFSHWYSLIRRDPSIGLSGTKTTIFDNRIYIDQELNSNSFCVAVSIRSESMEATSLLNSRAGEIRSAKSETIRFTLYITVAADNDLKSAHIRSDRQLSDAMETGTEAIYSNHAAEWHAFWERSFVRIPQDYIENLWYLTMYFANSNSRGAYPSHFCNGLWGFQHDFVPWNYFFHYNMQLAVWPMHAANHADLAMPYLNYRYNQLPYALEHAKICKGVDGALYTDVAAANGPFDKSTKDNLTPGPQIAEMMWQHWLYTGDKNFLRKKAWPVIRETASLYSNLVKIKDGKYHIYASQAYEGSPLMNDVITDHSMMRAIFRIVLECIEALDISEPDAAKWREILGNLQPFDLIPMEVDEYHEENERITLTGGIGAGKEALGLNVLSVGRYIKSQTRGFESTFEDSEYWSNKPDGSMIRETFTSDKLRIYYGFPDVELSPVFPSGLVGLSEKGSPIFNALVNQVRMHSHSSVADDISFNNDDKVPCMGWCMLPIILARLGLAEELALTLTETANAWQFYPNGFGHYGGYMGNLSDNNLRFHNNIVRDADDMDVNIKFPSWPFRHFDFEMLPILSTAVNEMLLQSFEGIIRVFPACCDKYSACFKLKAAGGVLIDSEISDGKVLFISISAERDANVRLASPWTSGSAVIASYIDNKSEKAAELKTKSSGTDDLFEFSIRSGQRCFITENTSDQSVTIVEERHEANKASKKLGRAVLGAPRMF